MNNQQKPSKNTDDKIVIEKLTDLLKIRPYKLNYAQIANFSGKYFDKIYDEVIKRENELKSQKIPLQNTNPYKSIKKFPNQHNENTQKIPEKNQIKKNSSKNTKKTLEKNQKQISEKNNISSNNSLEKSKDEESYQIIDIANNSENKSSNISDSSGDHSIHQMQNVQTFKNLLAIDENLPKNNFNDIQQGRLIQKNDDENINTNNIININNLNDDTYKKKKVNMNYNINNIISSSNEDFKNDPNYNFPLKEIVFKINYNTFFGQEIGILGSIDKLGNWNEDQILYLNWNEGNIWTGSIMVDKNQIEDFEFKFVICENKKILCWEFGDNNNVYFAGLFTEVKQNPIGKYNKYEYEYLKDKAQLVIKCKWNY